MPSRVRRVWRIVRIGDGFNRYVADATDARLACLEDLVRQLRKGTADIVPARFERDVFYIFACDVVISAVVQDDTILLTTVCEVEIL